MDLAGWEDSLVVIKLRGLTKRFLGNQSCPRKDKMQVKVISLITIVLGRKEPKDKKDESNE